MNNLDKNIDILVLSLLEFKKNLMTKKVAQENFTVSVCLSCSKLKKNCEDVFTKYNKGLSLIENIKKLQKEVTETNDMFVKLNIGRIITSDTSHFIK